MAQKSRIDNSCWYRVFDNKSRTWTNWKAGTLRAWSTDHEEFDAGPAHYPVGVVEDTETMRCFSVHVRDISFAAVPGS